MAEPQRFISCSDECGQRVPAETIESVGWTALQIRGGWRCPACQRALERVNVAQRDLDEGAV